MEMNVSASMGYQLENRENLRNAAKNILNNSGASAEQASKIIEKTLFENDRQIKELYTNSQLTALRASTQITINNSLKETIKYLKTHADKKVKKPIFGEIWNVFSTTNEESEKNPYKGELLDFQIDKNAKNIFAA